MAYGTYGTVQHGRSERDTEAVQRERKIVYGLAVAALVFGVVGITVQAQHAQREAEAQGLATIPTSGDEIDQAATNPATVQAIKSTKGTSVFGAESDGADAFFHISGEYERQSGKQIGEGFYRYQHIAQMHKPTTIKLIDTVSELLNTDTADENGCTPTWTVSGPDGIGGTTSMDVTADSAVVMFKQVGWHKLKVSVCTTAGTTETLSTTVMSRYVRREIRTLADSDREDFFNALQTVYKVSQTDGEAIYGSKFRSIETLVAKHLKGAASKECDHWHDDAGIMTHHIAFTLEMEQALQSINPSAAIPYWDYTSDAYIYNDWKHSEIFRDDWFGVANPGNDDHVIDRGIWAYTEVAKNRAGSDSPRNPYGLLRSPWNTNPVAYITRHNYVLGQKDGGWTMPDCSDFETGFDQTKLSMITNKLNGQLHGPVHIMIGGHWSINDDYNVTKVDGGAYLLCSKYLWRQGYVRCPESCSADTPTRYCTCSIPAAVDPRVTKGMTNKQFIEHTGLYNLTNLFSAWHSFLSDGFDCTDEEVCLGRAIDFLGHVGHAGEMFTSAAPYDPVFWPIHGLADRFLQLKRMMADDGTTTFDETWGYVHSGNTPSDTNHVCDWSGVEGMQLPTCTEGSCSGHKSNDIIPWSNFQNKNETYTNVEFYDFVSPNSDSLPYVYDTFTVWPGCSAQGIDFWSTDDDSRR